MSIAGRRAGLAGSRSGLFHEFARIAESLRPRWVLVENVPGLLSSNGGRDFGVVLGTLADIGYGVAWRVVDSRYFGVPQRRRRVFVLGALADGDPRAAAERAGEILAVGTRCERHPATRSEARQDLAGTLGASAGGSRGIGRYGKGADSDETDPMVVHALTSEGHDASEDGTGRGTPLVAVSLTSGGHPGSNTPGRHREDENLVAFHPTGGGAKGLSAESDVAPGTGTGTGRVGSVAVASAVGVRRLLPIECERLQGLPDGWTRVPETATDTQRYAAIGNAVTVNVAEWIGRRLMERV